MGAVWTISNTAPAEFTVGDTVYFRSGGTGVVVGVDKTFAYAARLSTYHGSTKVVGVKAWTNGHLSQLRQIESPDDFAREPFAKPVTFTYRNVYSDGSAGNTAHKSLDTAKLAAKVNKERIGILKIGSDGSSELIRCKPATRTSGYEPASFDQII
jgi:hypothetical protein